MALRRKRYRKCSVPDCIHSFGDNPGVTFHCYPRNTALYAEWLIKICNPNLRDFPYIVVRSTSAVCGRHFAAKDYQTPERKRLNRGAVPSLFLPEKSEDIKKNEEWEPSIDDAINERHSPLVLPKQSPNYVPDDNSDESHQLLNGIESQIYLFDQFTEYFEATESTSEDDKLFFESLLPHVRSIPYHDKLKFRNEIQDLVQKYTFKPRLGTNRNTNCSS